MGQSKKQRMETLDPQGFTHISRMILKPSQAQEEPQTKPPYVYLLMCDGKPVGVYVDESTAEYEMHLCKQGDEAESMFDNLITGESSETQHTTSTHTYETVRMTLTTHRLDY